MARYLFHIVPKQVPEGVSMVYILQTLAKQGRSQGAFKLSRLVYDKLHSYHIPPKLRTQIQMGDLTVRSKPFSDAEVLCKISNKILLTKNFSTRNYCHYAIDAQN